MVFVGAGVGHVARVPNDRKYFLGPNIAVIRVDSVDVLPGYLEHYLRSPLGRRLTLSFTKAVAQPSLSMGTIRQIPVVVPPVAEQEVLLLDVDERLSSVANVNVATAENSHRASRLRQSILKRAFEGKLVPQDPTDEPASVLLDRIRSERAKSRAGSDSKRPRGTSRRRRSNAAIE